MSFNNQETSNKNQPSVLTPSTTLGGLATTESTDKTINSAVALKTEPGTQSVKTALAADLASSEPVNSSNKHHSINGVATQTNQGMTNPIEGQQLEIRETSSFSRLMANNASNISDLAKEDVTMIVVTHEMGFAKEVGDRIMFFDEGHLVEESTPDVFFENPKEERSKLFLEQIL